MELFSALGAAKRRLQMNEGTAYLLTSVSGMCNSQTYMGGREGNYGGGMKGVQKN